MTSVGVDAVEQAEMVRKGVVSPAELVEEAVRRLERINPAINAVIYSRPEEALEEAEARELPVGPFRGVPFLVKDAVCTVAGQPYHHGMRALKAAGWKATTTSNLAIALRRAGLVTLGRTNVPELTTCVTTEPLAYGPTLNPWSPEHSAGGSSGGSAAAVAAGIVPAAHGNDMGGSIRIPASACGLVGLKPSRGRTSLGPEHAEYWGPSTHEGVLTRTVRDTAHLLDAIGCSTLDDPYPARPHPRPLQSCLDGIRTRLRIGFRTRLPLDETSAHPACISAVEQAIATLSALGHDVIDDSPSALDSEDGMLLGVVVSAGVAQDIENYSRLIGRPIEPDELEPLNQYMVQVGREMRATEYLDALRRMHQHSRRLISWWENADILVTPTLSEPPPLIGELGPQHTAEAVFPRMLSLAAFLAPWNISGQPAISLPLGRSDSGLPIGVQLVAAPGREDILVEVSSALEKALPWSARQPMIVA